MEEFCFSGSKKKKEKGVRRDNVYCSLLNFMLSIYDHDLPREMYLLFIFCLFLNEVKEIIPETVAF